MKKIKVRNWSRWQTYRSDRGMPPWIKLHRCLMRNIDWVTLTDEQRGQLVSIWILAADDDGKVPADAEALKLLCHMTNTPDLNLLRDKGFLDFDANVTPTRRQPDANLTPTWRQPDANVTPQRNVMSEECNIIEEKNPPTPRKRGRVMGAIEVVQHLNRITGKTYSPDKATKEIEGALIRGASVADCCEVLDYCWREWRDNPKMVGHVDKTTPFRKANFDRYLDEARAGKVQSAKVSPIRDDFVDFDQTSEERAAALEALSKLTGIARWA